eukprot:143058_1
MTTIANMFRSRFCYLLALISIICAIIRRHIIVSIPMNGVDPLMTTPTLLHQTCVWGNYSNAIIQYKDRKVAKSCHHTYYLQNITNINGQNCRFYLVNDKYFAYYHRFTCLLAALFHNYSCLQAELNGENKIQLIIGAKSGHSTYVNQIFFNNKNDTPYYYTDHSIINNVNPGRYFCSEDKKYNPWFSNPTVLNNISSEFFSLWYRYVMYKLNITRQNIGNTDKILIVNRKLKARQLKNVMQLKRKLEKGNMFQVSVVYFETLNYKQQLQYVLDKGNKYIITPHGSFFTNLIYINYMDDIKPIIIEVCPPYTTCSCSGTCFFYSGMLPPEVNKYYVGYVEQDIDMNCTQFCSYHAKEKKSIRGYVRDVNVRFDGNYFEQVIMNDINYSNAIHFGDRHYVYVNKYKFDSSTLNYYQKSFIQK